MTLTIELTTEEEARLTTAASREGAALPECARRVLAAHLPPLNNGEGTLALFARWEAEDGTDDPDELAACNREWEELKRDMNEDHAATGEEPLFRA